MLILLNKAPCSTKSKLDISMLNQTASDFTKAFFFGDSFNNTRINTLIINTTIEFVLDAKRFDVLERRTLRSETVSGN